MRAPIVLLGEAPGAEEERHGVPFCGPSGRVLWDALAVHGVYRDDVRVENVVEVRPEGNRLFSLSPEAIRHWQEDCIKRLRVLEGAQVIVPLGNVALSTVRGEPLPIGKTGKWKVRTANGETAIQWPSTIGSWRGSIFRSPLVERKVIPTWHPAFILRNAKGWPAWQGDLARIVYDSTFPELALDDPQEVLIDPDATERAEFLERVVEVMEHPEAVLAVDVETPGGQVACAGLALSDRWGIVVPVRSDTRAFLRQVLAAPIRKTFHFGMFDTYMLWRAGFPVARWWWDSRDMHHLLDPSDRHTLAYCCSRDRRTAFWKDERMYGVKGGDKGEYTKRALAKDQFRSLMLGCGKDVCHTHGLTLLYRERIRERGWETLYGDHKRRVSWACLELAQTGMRVDRSAWESARFDCEQQLVMLRERMRCVTGTDMVAKVGLARARVAKHFYETLGCRPVTRAQGVPLHTTNEVAVRKLMLKYKKAREFGHLVLAYAHAAKQRGWFQSKLTDDDRYLSQYSLIPVTGRLSSEATPDGFGGNGQNVDRSLKRVFIASRPSWCILKLDLSQAESRIVDGASGDPRALELARTPPWELDQHRLVASEVLEKSIEEVTPEERDVVGKRGRHASNYGMEGFRFSEVLLLETESRIVRTPEECTEILEGVFRVRPYIQTWQAWVREQVLSLGYLEDSYGLRISFPWREFRLSKEDFKMAYAAGPQGEVGKLLNQYGLLPARRMIRREKLEARIIQQEHDALAIEGPPAVLWRLAVSVVASLSTERAYPGRTGPWTLRMPVGVQVGRTLKGSVEWKRMPEEEEFLATCAEILSPT